MNKVELMARSLFWVLLAFIFVPSAYAGWKSDPQSSDIYFISIKKGSIAEVHHFDEFTVSVDNHMLTAEIPLDSVQTAVEIRDERMREFLFETKAFPTAILTADVSAVDINNLSVGQPDRVDVTGRLSLHGASRDISMSVHIVRLSQTAILISTAKPVIINAADFALLEGIAKLADLVGGIDIATAVPVGFSVLMRTQ